MSSVTWVVAELRSCDVNARSIDLDTGSIDVSARSNNAGVASFDVTHKVPQIPLVTSDDLEIEINRSQLEVPRSQHGIR